MISDEELVVPDSDEEDSDIELIGRNNQKLKEERKYRPFIIDSENDDETDSMDDGYENQTKSINKAIRRSIFNISRSHIIDASDSDETDFDDDDDNKANMDNVTDSRISKNKTVEVEKNISDNSVSVVTSSDTDNDGNNDEVHVTNVESPNSSLKSVTFISDSEVNSEKSIEDELSNLSVAVSLVKDELNAPNLDPIIAQKRAYIMCQIQNIEREMARTNTFLRQGNLNLLPDKGERLHLNLVKQKKNLKKFQDELATLPLAELNTNNNFESVVSRIRNDFNQESMNPNNLLKPTPNTNIEDFGKKALKTFQRDQALTVDRLEDLHGSLVSRPTNETLAADPKNLKISLMRHQKHALAWLQWRERETPPGGILADDMGLGKTLTMISLIIAQKDNDDDDDDDDDDWSRRGRAVKHQGGTLVVCPASLVSQWETEIKNRCKRGSLTVELYHGNNRETQPKRLARNDVVITTYNLLTREHAKHGVLFNIEWKRIILDEAHTIRNHKSKACNAVCDILARKRWALTGTPIHNKEMDLYATLKFLKCSPFDDLRVWKRWVDNKNAAGHERLATVMQSLMLRRTKQELMNNGLLDSLPEKSLEFIKVALDRDERLIYEKILVYSKTLFAQFLSQRAEKQHNFELGAGKFDGYVHTSDFKKTQFNKAQAALLARHADIKQHEILVLLLRLRQVCCHPSLINAMLDREDLEMNGLGDSSDNDLLKSMKKLNLSANENENANEENDIGVDERVAEHLLTSDNPVFDRARKSSKLRAILELVEKILNKGEKMIIVSQWSSHLDIIAEQLDKIKGARYKKFTGSVPVKHRQDIVDSFNSKGNDPQILLLSLTAGGVGLNLVGGNNLLLIDIHWNPQLESQAQDRIYRFGQKKNVFIYKFICSDTIEERIKNLQEKKLDIASSVLTGSRHESGAKLSLDDLKSLFSI